MLVNQRPSFIPYPSSLAFTCFRPSGKRLRSTAQSPVFSYQPVSMTKTSMPMRCATSISSRMRSLFIEARYGWPFQAWLRSW